MGIKRTSDAHLFSLSCTHVNILSSVVERASCLADSRHVCHGTHGKNKQKRVRGCSIRGDVVQWLSLAAASRVVSSRCPPRPSSAPSLVNLVILRQMSLSTVPA